MRFPACVTSSSRPLCRPPPSSRPTPPSSPPAAQPAAALHQSRELEQLLKEELGPAPALATRPLAQKAGLAGAGSPATSGRGEEGKSRRAGAPPSLPPSSTSPRRHSSVPSL